MTYVRERSSLLLIELAVAITFFMLLSVTTLRLFSVAYENSVRATQSTRALLAAQDLTERLVGEADAEKILLSQGFSREDEGVYAREDEGFSLRVTLARAETEAGCLTALCVRAVDEAQALLLELPSAYYLPNEEVSP